MLFVNLPNKQGLPNGIRLADNGKYTATYNGIYLGTFDTLEEAYSIYANKKEEVIKLIAEEYRSIVPKKVYDALYAYKVNIMNDKNYNIA